MVFSNLPDLRRVRQVVPVGRTVQLRTVSVSMPVPASVSLRRLFRDRLHDIWPKEGSSNAN